MDILNKNWSRLGNILGSDPVVSDTIFKDLKKRYREPHRHFHTLDHLRNILEFLKPDARPDDEAATLIAVTFWHDAVYDTQNPDLAAQNEKRSARMARADLRTMAATDAFAENVALIIEETKSHDVSNGDIVSSTFMDADLATLGGPEDIFWKNCVNVYKECAHVPQRVFLEARLERFIDPMLKKDKIYLLPENQERLGQTAFENLRLEKEKIIETLRLI